MMDLKRTIDSRYSSYTKVGLKHMFLSLSKTFSRVVLTRAIRCTVSGEESQCAGLLTSDGDLTTGLVVIVAEPCSWLPGDQTDDFTVCSARCLSAYERWHSRGGASDGFVVMPLDTSRPQ